jgi:hypothetical protein
MPTTFFNWTSGTGGDYILSIAYLYHKRKDFIGYVMGSNQWVAPYQKIHLSTEEDIVGSRFIHMFKCEWHMPWKEICEHYDDVGEHLFVQTHDIIKIIDSTVDDYDRIPIYENSVNLYVSHDKKDFIKDMIHAKTIQENRSETDNWVDEDNKEFIDIVSKNYDYSDVFYGNDKSQFHSLLSDMGIDVSDENFIKLAEESLRLYNLCNIKLQEIYHKCMEEGKATYLLDIQQKRYNHNSMSLMVLNQENLLNNLTKLKDFI